jgi:hypothetical protein
MGLCTNAQVIVVRSTTGPPENNRFNRILERALLVPLVTILRDMTDHPDRVRRAIVNLLVGYSKIAYDVLPRPLTNTVRKSIYFCLYLAGEL